MVPLVGPHQGHLITVRTAKHNCGAYEVHATCSCGSTWHEASGGCHIHPTSPAEGDESLEQVVREALALPDYLWPGGGAPEWWVTWVTNVAQVYHNYPEFSVAAISSAAANLAAVIDGVLNKRLPFKAARAALKDFRAAKMWRPG